MGERAKRRPERELIQGVGQRLADRRRALGLTQAALAEKAGIAEETMSRFESGKIAISLERLVTFAELLDTSLEELLLSVSEHPADEARALIRSLKDLPRAERDLVLNNALHLASLLRKGHRRG